MIFRSFLNPAGKIASNTLEKWVFVESAFNMQCYLVKNTLLRTFCRLRWFRFRALYGDDERILHKWALAKLTYLLSLVTLQNYVFLPGVQCAAVNVICELARKNPRNYLALAPLFFKLMTTSSNNWMLIKIIKLVICYLDRQMSLTLTF